MNQFEALPEDVLLAMLGWGEARGESLVGQLATMWVAYNRAEKKSRALKDVILQPWQFSCFNPRDPNYHLLPKAHIEDPDHWYGCLAISRLLLGGHTLDPTNGATHFYSTQFPTPYWARLEKGWVELTQIGHHIFGVAK